MSMHIEGPWLSTNGKSKSKKKFRNAAEARASRELTDSWNALTSKWGTTPAKKTKSVPEKLVYKLSTPSCRETKFIPSKDTGHLGTISSKPIPKYTGTAIIGISQMAKSNAVPVFNTDHIVEIGKMRR